EEKVAIHRNGIPITQSPRRRGRAVVGTLRPSARHRALSKLFENVDHNVEQFRLSARRISNLYYFARFFLVQSGHAGEFVSDFVPDGTIEAMKVPATTNEIAGRN